MHANSILALSGLLSLVAAVPHASAERHQHHRRVLVWETVTQEVIETVAVTKTIWLEPGESPPAGYTPPGAFTPAAYTPSSAGQPPHNSPQLPQSTQPAPVYSAPAASSPVASPAYTPPAQSSAVQAPPASVPSSSPVQASPASIPSSSSYVAPAPAPTSSYVPPAAPVTPSSTYVAPAPSSSTPSSGGAGGSGLTTGMAAAGTYYTGDLTWYEVGLGACGISSTSAQNVVAISEEIFDSYGDAGNPNNNPLCGKTVTITGSDGTLYTASIVDRCTGCAPADLDLSQGFFNTVTNFGNGRVPGIKWRFN